MLFGAVAVVLSATLPGSSATAQSVGDSGPFTAVASADAARALVQVPDYLIISDFVDGGGPSAQASLDSLGTSNGFASFPYPGETGVAILGLAAILTSKPLPQYPFYISTSNPTRLTDRVDNVGYHLASDSDASTSAARAQMGETNLTGDLDTGAISDSRVHRSDDGAVVAESSTRVGLQIGPITIRGFESSARVVRTPEGETTPTSTFAFGVLRIAGIEIALTDKGIAIGPTVLPVGDLAALTRSLAGQGTTVEVLPAALSKTAVLSAGLRIRTEQVIPGIDRQGIVELTIGRSFASIEATAAAGPTPTDLDLGGSSDVLGPVLGGAPSLPVLAAPAAPTASGPPPAPSVSGSQLIGLPLTPSTWAVYPVLLLAAVVLLAGAFGSRRRART